MFDNERGEKVSPAEFKAFDNKPHLEFKGTLKAITHDKSVGMSFPIKVPHTEIVVTNKDGTKVRLPV